MPPFRPCLITVLVTGEELTVANFQPDESFCSMRYPTTVAPESVAGETQLSLTAAWLEFAAVQASAALTERTGEAGFKASKAALSKGADTDAG